MRYFRVTCNPVDPFVVGGPGGNSVLLRLPFYLTGKMFYCEFRDSGYVKVPDSDMGIVGPIFDVITLGGRDSVLPYYKLFQETALPQGVLDAAIPLWTANAVTLVQPPAAMPPVVVWPVIVVPG